MNARKCTYNIPLARAFADSQVQHFVLQKKPYFYLV